MAYLMEFDDLTYIYIYIYILAYSERMFDFDLHTIVA